MAHEPHASVSGTTATARAIVLMKDNLAEPLALDDLARAARFSPYHFHRMFTRVTGTTPARFLTGLRIAESRRLLLHSPLSVAGVGAAVGYASLGTFSTRFTCLVGMPPAAFRRLIRGVRREPAADRPPYVFTAFTTDADATWRPWPAGTGPGEGELRFKALVLTPGRTLLDALVEHDWEAYLLAEGALLACGDRLSVTAVRMRRPRLIDLPPLSADALRGEPLRAASAGPREGTIS